MPVEESRRRKAPTAVLDESPTQGCPIEPGGGRLVCQRGVSSLHPSSPPPGSGPHRRRAEAEPRVDAPGPDIALEAVVGGQMPRPPADLQPRWETLCPWRNRSASRPLSAGRRSAARSPSLQARQLDAGCGRPLSPPNAATGYRLHSSGADANEGLPVWNAAYQTEVLSQVIAPRTPPGSSLVRSTEGSAMSRGDLVCANPETLPNDAA